LTGEEKRTDAPLPSHQTALPGSTSSVHLSAAGGASIVDDGAACVTSYGQANPDKAPPCKKIELRDGRGEAYLVRFMQEDHFPRPSFACSTKRKRMASLSDVAAMR